MKRTSRLHWLGRGMAAVVSVVFVGVGSAQVFAAGAQAAQKDAFPNGCVDCHTSASGPNKTDMRVSTQMAGWTKEVSPALLVKVKAAAADPAKIKGKHPGVAKAGANVPQSCLAACHKKGSTIAPAFATMMHTVHLTGAGNHFVAEFKGDCTHCHKLDPKTGSWKMPSGAEK